MEVLRFKLPPTTHTLGLHLFTSASTWARWVSSALISEKTFHLLCLKRCFKDAIALHIYTVFRFELEPLPELVISK